MKTKSNKYTMSAAALAVRRRAAAARKGTGVAWATAKVYKSSRDWATLNYGSVNGAILALMRRTAAVSATDKN